MCIHKRGEKHETGKNSIIPAALAAVTASVLPDGARKHGTLVGRDSWAQLRHGNVSDIELLMTCALRQLDNDVDRIMRVSKKNGRRSG